MEVTIDQAVDKAFDRYIEILEKKGCKPNPSPTDGHLKVNEALDHALWMCKTAKKSQFSSDKKNRWLGFIQATIIFNKLSTIDNERNITRPWFTKNVKEP